MGRGAIFIGSVNVSKINDNIICKCTSLIKTEE